MLTNFSVETSKSPILLFDGVCNLCNATVRFTIRRDRKGIFKFAALQSETGQMLLKKHGLDADDFDSFVLIEGEDYYLKSTAALRVMKTWGGVWKIWSVFKIVPAPLRDLIYSLIAKNRYRVFGRRSECVVPTDDVRERFL